MELAKTVNINMAINILNSLKQKVAALDMAIEIMVASEKEEQPIAVLKELRNEYFSRLKIIEEQFQRTQINLY